MIQYINAIIDTPVTNHVFNISVGGRHTFARCRRSELAAVVRRRNDTVNDVSSAALL